MKYKKGQVYIYKPNRSIMAEFGPGDIASDYASDVESDLNNQKIIITDSKLYSGHKNTLCNIRGKFLNEKLPSLLNGKNQTWYFHIDCLVPISDNFISFKPLNKPQ